MDDYIRKQYSAILKSELIKALGCTEPIAVAYAAAKARSILGAMPESCVVRCSGNIVKNVKGVTVPNSDGMKGISTATVLGIVGGDADSELSVLQSVKPEDIKKTQELLATDFCKAELAEGVENLYIDVVVKKGEESAEVLLKDRHTNIIKIVKNGEVIFEKNDEMSKAAGEFVIDKSTLNVKDIIEYAETAPLSEFEELVLTQVECNMAIAKEGLTKPYGTNVGQTLLAFAETPSVEIKARAYAAAGSDARMSGCPLPVVINSGSGNQGITVSMPIAVYAEHYNIPREKMLRALALGNLISVHQKRHIGNLSAYCGATSAAAGAACGIAWMMGDGYEVICGTIINSIATIGGMVCDGAKSSCAAKIASAVETALTGWHMAQKGRVFAPGEGIVKGNIEDTIRSVGRMGKIGMASTDIEILNIMLEDE
ncbi:MAG: serine dehydratase subunit alpha family protein [Firmicutes bacterium]|nr:serine dehydratase subunit alpha family protein [Bacillota bacterium]